MNVVCDWGHGSVDHCTDYCCPPDTATPYYTEAAIREKVAHEIEKQGRAATEWLAQHQADARDMGRLIGTEDAYRDAIRIARGEKYGLEDLAEQA